MAIGMYDHGTTFDSSVPHSHAALESLLDAPQQLLDLLPVAVYICRLDGAIARYNRRATELWRRSPAIGDPAHRFCGAHRVFLPDGTYVAPDVTPMAKALTDGLVTTNLDVIFERVDGTKIWVRVNIAPLRDFHGNIIGAVNCFQDITASKALEEDLLASQAELEDFFENGAICLHIVGADGTILRANQAELKLLGYAHDEYVGQHISKFHADQSCIVEILSRLSCGGTLKNYPARLRAKDGSIKYVEITSTAHFRDGKFINSRCFTVDVTDTRRAEFALRESEQRLAATYEHAPVGIAETDGNGKLLRVNEAFCAISGYSREELASFTFAELTHEEDREEDLALYTQQVLGQLDRYVFEKRYVRKDGKISWVSVVSSAVKDDEGKFLYGIRVVQDINERKQAQERQQMLMGELNHRIKNTLATVQSLALQTARKAPDPSHFYEKFQGRLVALSKAHSLLTRGHWNGAQLRDIIEEQVLPYREGDGRRIMLNGDTVELTTEQAVILGMVFHELMTNAIKHGSLSWPSGRVKVDWLLRSASGSTKRSLQVLWKEMDGPPAKIPEQRGFGSVFVERSVRNQLDGTVKMEFLDSGFNCHFDIPLTPQAVAKA